MGAALKNSLAPLRYAVITTALTRDGPTFQSRHVGVLARYDTMG